MRRLPSMLTVALIGVAWVLAYARGGVSASDTDSPAAHASSTAAAGAAVLADCSRDPMRALQSAVTSLRAQRAGKSKHPFCAATAGGSKDVLTQSSLFSVGGVGAPDLGDRMCGSNISHSTAQARQRREQRSPSVVCVGLSLRWNWTSGTATSSGLERAEQPSVVE